MRCHQIPSALVNQGKWICQFLLLLGLVQVVKPGWAAEDSPVPAQVLRYSVPLPEGAISRMGVSRECLTANGAAYTPDGERLATVNGDAVVYLWYARTGKLVAKWPAKHPAESLTFSANGKTLFLEGNSHVSSLSAVDGKSLQRFSVRLRVLNLVSSPDAKTLAVAHPGELSLWDVASGKRTHRIQGLLKSSLPVTFTRNGKHLVTVNEKGVPVVYDTATGTLTRSLVGMPARKDATPPAVRVNALALSPDRKRLIGGSSSSALTIWSTATWRPVRELVAEKPLPVQSLAFRPNGKQVAVGGTSGSIQILDVSSGKVVHNILFVSRPVRRLEFSQDGSYLTFIRSNNWLHTWKLGKAATVHLEKTPHFYFHQLAFSPDGKRLVSSPGRGHIRLWDVATGKQLAKTPTSLDFRYRAPLLIGRNGKFVRACSSSQTYNWNFGEFVKVREFPDPLCAVSRKALAPDGATVAGVGQDGNPRLFDSRTGKEIRSFPLPKGARIILLRFSGSGHRLLGFDGRDERYYAWDVATGESLDTIEAKKGANFEFAADGRTLFFFYFTVRGYEVGTGLERFQFTPQVILAIASSPDGRLIAMSYGYGRVVVRDTITGKVVMRRKSTQLSNSKLVFSSDSRMLASASSFGTILVWKVPKVDSPPPPKNVDLETLWTTLGSTDAKAAHKSMAFLAAMPDKTVPLLTARLKPEAVKLTDKQIAELVAKLDHRKSKVRDEAQSKLAKLGWAAEDALRDASKTGSLEARTRIRQLLNNLHGKTSPRRMRALRSIQVLEQIGNAKAVELMKVLQHEKFESIVRQEIKASLARLNGSS